MAKYTGPSCRLCRREGMKLFLKGARCQGPNCAFSRRDYLPGQHGQLRAKLSNYGLQLREKQKLKRIYGVLERQFIRYFKMAERSKGVTGKMLLQLLERRLDNVIFRLCFAISRAQARQIVNHGWVYIKGHRVDKPSYLVKKGDLIQINTKEGGRKLIKDIISLAKERGIPSWLKADLEEIKGEVIKFPERDEIQLPIQEQLIVELYSK